jgi:hypothetical protein
MGGGGGLTRTAAKALILLLMRLLYILSACLEVVYVGLGRRFYLPILEVPGGVGNSKHGVLN